MISRIEVAHTAVDLTSSPIEPSWIIKGNPVAQSALLTKSSDGLAWTMVWQCSEGSFHWYYDLDETSVILEGSFVLENDTMTPTRYGPGDVIFFKDGAHAKWHVEGHVRKLAFLRKTSPALLGFALRAFSKIKRTVVAARKRDRPRPPPDGGRISDIAACPKTFTEPEVRSLYPRYERVSNGPR